MGYIVALPGGRGVVEIGGTVKGWHGDQIVTGTVEKVGRKWIWLLKGSNGCRRLHIDNVIAASSPVISTWR